jgi:hypothetical protein
MHFMMVSLLCILLLFQFEDGFAQEGDNLQLAKNSENPLAKLAVVPIRLNIYPNVTAAAGGSPTTGFPNITTSTIKAAAKVNAIVPFSSIPLPPPPPEKFKGTLNTFDLNPAIPVELTEKQYLLLRWQQAISFAEDVYAPHSFQNGLGDANPSIDWVYAFTNDLMLGLGGAIVVPTATTHFLGMGKWCGGPSFTGIWTPGKWVVGGIAQNIFSFAGPSGRPDVNIMTIQPLVNYNFDHGWFLSSNPYIIANWNNPPGQKWTIPVGGGIGKLFTLDKQPMTFSLTAYWYPVKPTGGPDYSIRVTLQYLFPQDQKKKGS